jgi:hypothetical protein
MKRTSIQAHTGLESHKMNVKTWKQQQPLRAQRAQQLTEQVAAAYSLGPWSSAVPTSYPNPHPTGIPAALSDLPDLPLPEYMSLEREHIPIVPPPVTNRNAERERLEEQARLLRQLVKERDEFGEQFFDENDESVELREAFEALGEFSFVLCASQICL